MIQEETGITNVVDPWGGSYMMESLTQEIADKAWALIEEVESKGVLASLSVLASPNIKTRDCAKQLANANWCCDCNDFCASGEYISPA